MFTATISIKKLRKKSYKMLKDVTYLLNKYEIIYWLDFGSLLGAARNGEAIPWDGDFDLSTLQKEKLINSDFINDLEKNGYNVIITNSNIKIKQSNWKFGNYTLDIHTYIINDKNEIEYRYGDRYDNKFAKLLSNLLHNIYYQIRPSKFFLKSYPTYGAICRALILSGINSNELETIENIIITANRRNNIYDFNLKIGKIFFSMTPEKRIGNIEKNKLTKLFSKFPNSMLVVFYFIIKYLLKFYKSIPESRVYFPKYFFNKFEEIKFNNQTFNSPAPMKKYLERIYGYDWMKPIVVKNKNYLKKISYLK